MRPTANERRRALKSGHRAETLVTLYLRCKFYRILARRFTVSGGEIDIIASRGDTIAFVEVKARGSIAVARAAIDAQKRRRMARAARAFLAGNAAAMRYAWRVDAVYVAPWRWPRHVRDAFPLDLD